MALMAIIIFFLFGGLFLLILRRPILGVYLSLFLVITGPKFFFDTSIAGDSKVVFFATRDLDDSTTGHTLGFGDIAIFACLTAYLFGLRRKARITYNNPVSKAFILFLIVFLFCEAFNFWGASSKAGEIEGTILLLQKAFLFFFVIQTVRSKKQVITLFQVLLASTVITCVLGFFQLGFSEQIIGEIHKFYRMASVFDAMPASFAAFLVITFCLLAQFTFREEPIQPVPLPYLYVVMGLVVFCLFFAFSTSGHVTFVLALVMTYFTLSPTRRRVLISGIIVVFIIGFISSPFLLDNLASSFTQTFTTDNLRWSPSLNARIQLWSHVREHFWSLVLLGSGFSEFFTWDNEWLFVLQISGTIGLIAFLNLVIIGIRFSLRVARSVEDPLLAAFGRGMAIAQVCLFIYGAGSGFYLLGRPSRVYWILEGALIAYYFIHQQEKRELEEAEDELAVQVTA